MAPNAALRSKDEVLLEHYGTTDWDQIIRAGDHARPVPLPNQWYKMELPYEAPNCPRIPSIEEINKELEPFARSWAGGYTCRIDNFLVKKGYHPGIIQEAETMLFLQNIRGMRVPKVYTAFRSFDETYQCDAYFFVAKIVKGEVLDLAKWMGFNEQVKQLIGSKIATQFKIMRSIPSEGFYGTVQHGSWPHYTHGLCSRYKKPCGPYESYDEFFSALFECAELRAADTCRVKKFLERDIKWLSDFKKAIGESQNSQPVFTHMNPSFENVVVNPKFDPSGVIVDWKVTLLNWDCAGWWPAYMQIIQLRDSIVLDSERQVQEVELFLEQVMPHWKKQFSNEVKVMREINHYSFFC